ncbi:MAG: DUF1080 domain-containing protein [Pirellulales bacterium]|nr:DUF1080 domain-containing protein [Pirellulales bacterium]
MHFARIFKWLSLLVAFTAAVVRAQQPTDAVLFNGQDLIGWEGDTKYWKVEEGQLVGVAKNEVSENTFLWSKVPVENFFLSVSVKLTPNHRNSGIQFRSSKLPPSEALGYQADIGQDFWGRLYHESGRGKLVWNDAGEQSVKPNQWNHYEILAVGHHIWLAVNGTLSVTLDDPHGEIRGRIALQIHSGPAQEVRFKEFKLIHNPKIELAGYNEAQLLAALKQVGVAEAEAATPSLSDQKTESDSQSTK